MKLVSKDTFDFAGDTVVTQSKTYPDKQETKPVALLTERSDGLSFPPFIIQATTPLTWKQSGIYSQVREVRISPRLEQGMKECTSFANWIRTVITCHITNNPLDDKRYPVPDQFRDEYGIEMVTVESFSKDALDEPLDRYGKFRPQPELKEYSIYILI